MDKVAIVILNYNGIEYLKKFLPGVLKHSHKCKVVVGDNSSTDDSVAYLKESFPEVTLVCLKKNYGFSKGYNLVLQQVKAKYYILLNSDVEVTPGWAEPLITLMDEDPTIAACQPKILSFHQKDTFEHAGAAGGFIDKYGYPFCRGRIFDTLEKDSGQYDDLFPIFWATGACFVVRSEIFHQFGGFDDDFFAHMEEIDLCWRLHLAGYKVMYQGNSKVYHVGGGTLPTTNPRKMFLNFRNSLYMLYKNLPQEKKIFTFFLRGIFDAMAVAKFFVSGKWGYSKAILRAYLCFFKTYKNFKNKKIRYKSTTSTITIPIYSGSIIVSYFIKQKKVFSEILFSNTIRGYFFALGVF